MRTLFGRVLSYLHHLDNKVSGHIHQIDNKIVSIILYPFAAFFHPGLIWIAFLSMYYFSGYNLEFLIVYIVGVLFCLMTIYFLKKALKRYVFLIWKEIVLYLIRLIKNLRILEKNKKIMLCQAVMLYNLHYLQSFYGI